MKPPGHCRGLEPLCLAGAARTAHALPELLPSSGTPFPAVHDDDSGNRILVFIQQQRNITTNPVIRLMQIAFRLHLYTNAIFVEYFSANRGELSACSKQIDEPCIHALWNAQ